jgi:hypothetical protein
MSVPMPLMRMAMLGSNPMRIGASTVAPNIAMTCCTPIAAGLRPGQALVRRDHAALLQHCAGFSVQSNIPIAAPPAVKSAAMLGALPRPCKAASALVRCARGTPRPRARSHPSGSCGGPGRSVASSARRGCACRERLAVRERVDAVAAVVHHQRRRIDARADRRRLELPHQRAFAASMPPAWRRGCARTGRTPARSSACSRAARRAAPAAPACRSPAAAGA